MRCALHSNHPYHTMQCTPSHLLLIAGKTSGVLAGLGVLRGLWWLVDTFLLAPHRDPLHALPGPRAPSFFASHFAQAADPDATPRVYADWTARFGRTLRYHGFGRHDLRLLSFDVRAVAHVLTAPAYARPWLTRAYLGRLLGRGVFSAEGAEHRAIRRLVGPAFTAQAAKDMVPIFVQKAEELRDRWDAMMALDAPQVLDVAHWVSRTSFDVFGLAALDYHFNALQEETEPGTIRLMCAIGHLTSESVYCAYRRMFAISDRASRFAVLKRIYCPILETIWVSSFPFCVTPIEIMQPTRDERIMRECLHTIHSNGVALVSRKRETIKNGAAGHSKDILSLLIRADIALDASSQLSDQELVDHITSFLFVGADSTALAITWCLHLLALHPDVQTRLRDEITAAPPLRHNAAADMIDSLPFLDAVVRETLRVCPPLHGTVRVATADDLIPISAPVELRDGTLLRAGECIRIRKGSIVHIPLEGLNMLQDIWGPDAHAFDPDRWTRLPPPARPPAFPGLANVMSFSFGPAACPGYRIAILETKAVLATLVPHFLFAPVEGVEIGKFNAVSTKPFVRGQLDAGGCQLPLNVSRYLVA
ncbi:unnamed protein product [Mycena citricolor]|uniref:Cytochrome P450 n=1 Tax=Mycena citricolor TaxID=2018698 RepID=A0AAD2HQ25_9AGAR|nr:unnamed protein product [Mycena citricolor]